ncbi:hypothetical protein [Fontibacillus sp. BL9]|uniref:hypothetical protein n=1 Tax=Fontibacillus sp. BL9 TaxID=3389971 RepID=UPI00397D381A
MKKKKYSDSFFEKMSKINISKLTLNLFIISLALILLVGVPIFINELYKSEPKYVTRWEASDVLAYYATILGALATIFAVVITILYTERSKRIDRIKQIQPLIDCRIEPMSADDFKLHGLDDKLIVLDFMDVKIVRKIEKSMVDNVRKNKAYYFEYRLTNVGSGNALLIKININGYNYREFNLLVNQSEIFRFYVAPSYYDEEGNTISFRIKYINMDQSQYYQQDEFFHLQKYQNKSLFLNVSDRVLGQKTISKPEYLKS